MSPPTATADIRRNVFSAEDGITVQTTDHLIRDTKLMLERAGIKASPSKVSRLVRAYNGPLTIHGGEYVAHLADRLALTVQKRREVADQYRRWISYADPTGDAAAARVDRERAR